MSSPKQLIAYDRWANDKMLTVIAAITDDKLKYDSLKLMSHILQAQIVWAHRVLKKSPITKLWPSYSYQECRTHLEVNNKLLTQISAHLEGKVEYKNSKDAVFSNNVEDVLQHLIIHGQHHRAQISLLLRQNGMEPPATDYIFYIRLSPE